MPETAATMRQRSIQRSLNLLQFALIGRRMIRRDAHVERQRLEPRRADFDPVRTRLDVQPLEDAVEVVDDADVVAVDVHFCLARLDLQAQRSLIAVRTARLWRRRIRAVPRIVIAAIVPAIAAVHTAGLAPGPPGVVVPA